MKEQLQQQQHQDTAASNTMMLRGTAQHRSLQAPPRSKNKIPLNQDKDAAARPFDADQAFKGTDSFQQRPSVISYFPDQVLQVSYIVSVLDKDSHTTSSLARTTNSGVVSNKNKNGDNGNNGRNSHPHNVLSNDKLYLTDLKEALDVLATELAPAAYPDLWVREITTSIDRFFPLVCPPDSNLANCQDVTSSIGIYLSPKPQDLTGDDVSEVQNLYGADDESNTRNKNNAIDPNTLSKELLAFETSLQEAIANNRLQEIIEGFYGVGVSGGPAVDPPVYVVPSTPITSGEDTSGGGGNSGNDGNGNGNNTDNEGGDSGSGPDSVDDDNENGPAPETVEGGDNGDDPIDDVNEPSNNGNDEVEPSNPGNDGGDSSSPNNQGNNVNDEDNTEGGDNFQIGSGGDTGSEFAPDSDNEVMPGGDSDSSGGEESNGIGGEDENVDTGDESDGGAGNDGNPAWLPNDPTDTSTGGSAVAASSANTVNAKGGLSTGAIVGIALAAVAVVVVVLALCYLRRLKRKNQRARQSRSGSSSRKSKSQKSANEEESISNDSSNKGSLGLFLYSGVQRQSRSDTNHSRNTAPTVSASSSDDTSHSAASTAAYGGRGTEQWKKDEVMVPMNTSRGLLVLDSVEEEKSSEGENDPNDPLLGYGEVSDLYIPPGDGEVFEMEACVALSSSSSSSGGSVNCDEDVEAYIVPSPASSRRPSNGSRSSSESPLKAMAARSLRALRGNNRSIERSKQELEDVLSGQGFQTNDEEDDLEVIHLSPKKDSGESQGNAVTNVRPLSSLDEAIMNGDWAAVGATAALMAASLSPEDKAKRPESRPTALNSPPPEKAELDRLIEQGDWQAVMIAAAQYDAEGGATSSMGEEASDTRSRTSTQGSDTLDGSYWSGNDHSSAYNSATTRGSVQTSASQKEKLEEIRVRVEQLVRDVVPDEAENVDEMMDQFKGKEEELLETLRTMKERDVAKKARMESQKIARRNTRSKENEQKDGVPQADDASPTSTTMPTTVFGQSGDAPVESGDDDDSDFSPEPAAVPLQGSFDQVVTKKGGDDSAAAAAAEWAIDRRLSELMVEDQNKDSEPMHTIV